MIPRDRPVVRSGEDADVWAISHTLCEVERGEKDVMDAAREIVRYLASHKSARSVAESLDTESRERKVALSD